MSSKVVALVEHDPWAEELRLGGGERLLPSDTRLFPDIGMDLPSPPPLSKLGV